ncbi:MAG: site-specific DNA-methyltransferase [Pirellulales bacterium]
MIAIEPWQTMVPIVAKVVPILDATDSPRVPDDVWELPRLVGNTSERLGIHPCQLPEELLRRIILYSTAKNDLILDPVSGTGTTARVAQMEGRRYIAIEEQETFVAAIRERLSRQHQTSLFG